MKEQISSVDLAPLGSLAMSTRGTPDISMDEKTDMSKALVPMEKSEDGCESCGEADLSEHENVYDVFDLREEEDETFFFFNKVTGWMKYNVLSQNVLY